MDINAAKRRIAVEAKALVALAFRNGPVEDLHAGKTCPTCHGQPGYSRITDEEMKRIMKSAVDQLYRLRCLKVEDARMYESEIGSGEAYTAGWDEPLAARCSPDPGERMHGRTVGLDSGVLVNVPLRSDDFNAQESGQPYVFEQYRNRLEQLLSYVGFTIRHRRIAVSYKCEADQDGLRLLLIGADAAGIQAELVAYLQALRLPRSSRLTLFRNSSSQPTVIHLN